MSQSSWQTQKTPLEQQPTRFGVESRMDWTHSLTPHKSANYLSAGSQSKDFMDKTVMGGLSVQRMKNTQVYVERVDDFLLLVQCPITVKLSESTVLCDSL